MPHHIAAGSGQLNVRVDRDLLAQLKVLATRKNRSVSELVRSILAAELARADADSGSLPDESTIRETAILIAVELVIKLQEASIPGGVTLSRRLLEDAARSAIERIELVEARLEKHATR